MPRHSRVVTMVEMFPWIVAGLILSRLSVELWLAQLNRRHVLANADQKPEALREVMDDATFAKSVRYTLARGRLGQLCDCYDTLVLLVVLFSGVLPWALTLFQRHLGASAWGMAAYLLVVGVCMSLPDLPVDWHEQFKLEARFGFNTSTQKTWWFDRAKGLALAGVLGYPLLVLVLKLVEWTGDAWWFWAWAALLAFQVTMMVLAPVLILPLFNKFTPLPHGGLRERLTRLAGRTAFHARSIEVMDGSRRSRHSNAFFTGLGRFRKIVLFDTLVSQLSEAELESVLAHEIGHYKRKHIPKMLAWSALSSLTGLAAVAWLARQEWFYHAFGFDPGSVGPVLLLAGLLAGTITFWLSPLLHWWSRKHEYEADAFAVKAMGEATSLTGALRKLSEKNLSNLTPHPVYSGFYYSHPTLLERERALQEAASTQMQLART